MSSDNEQDTSLPPEESSSSSSSEDESSTVENIATETVEKIEEKVTDAASELRQRTVPSSVSTESSTPKNPTIGNRIESARSAIQSTVTDFSKDPGQILPIIKNHLNSRCKHGILIIFFIIWLPFAVTIGGSLSGQLVKLFFKNFHYFAGVVAAVYVWIMKHTGSGHEKQKNYSIFLIASIVPIFMVEDSSFLIQLFTLIAFAGAPLIYATIYAEDLKQGSKEEILLLFSTAPAITFVIAAGGVSYLHHIILCVEFGIAAFVAHKVLPIVISKVPEAQKALVLPNEILIFVVLELLVANIISLIFEIIIVPQSVVDEQYGFFANLFLTILGVAFLSLSHLLSTQALPKFGVPEATAALINKAYLGVIGLSFVVILLVHAVAHWFETTAEATA